MCSFHVAEIIHLALVRLADTTLTLYVCYIVKPLVSPVWTLRQNSHVAKWKIFHLKGEDLSSWLCVKYVLEYMQLLRLRRWLFFVLLCYACTVYQSTGNLPKVKQVSWKAGRSKLTFDRCFFLNWLSKTLCLYLKSVFCWLLYTPYMLLVVVLKATWWQERDGALQRTGEGPERLHRAKNCPSRDWNCRKSGWLSEGGVMLLKT